MPGDTGLCRQVVPSLSRYLDRELPPEKCAELQAHISQCPACSRVVEGVRQNRDLCSRYQPSAVPKPLGESAHDQLRAAWEKMFAHKAGSGV